MYPGLTPHPLDDRHRLHLGRLPEALIPDASGFDAIWDLHPADYHVIKMHGRPVKTPRWQQAYGADYHYTGRINRALPTPPELAPLLTWAQGAIEPRLNGMLLNWYDGQLGHYIGRHRDDIRQMVPGTPIVTLSFGEARIFRMRPWRAKGMNDVPAQDGSIILIPFDTNRAWTHEVPRRAADRGRRISVTLRAFYR